MQPFQLELLAPARTADIGMEAVNHGADAVYIGGPSFGARATADNTVTDIARLVTHAHRFHSRIFVTMNTIMRDDELPQAQKLIHQLYDAGVDALIIQDMGLLEMDLPPIQLHASTQCDIRTPEKAKFLQDAGFSQIVLARELTLQQIQAIRDHLGPEADPGRAHLEYFVHGALCVAYSGQCYISHAHTGRSANRGDCSQACRLPYEVKDAQGRIIAHNKHVLSMKDNNQSDNLAALVEAGIRSFKIEGRYKDMAYVKNITAHYRLLLDELLNARPDLSASSSGQCTFTFQPDPNQNFNREFTDYFANGRQIDIGAFDSPKNPGQSIGWVDKVQTDHLVLVLDDPASQLANGDGLCYYDLHKNLHGLQTNRVQAVKGSENRWQVWPKDPMDQFKDLRKGTAVNRNRSMDWVRTLEKPSAQRRIDAWLQLDVEPTDSGIRCACVITDEDGVEGRAELITSSVQLHTQADAQQKWHAQLGRLGQTPLQVVNIAMNLGTYAVPPTSSMNVLRRDAVAHWESQRTASCERLPRRAPNSPLTPYPDDAISYLANVYNQKAHDFYAKHGVTIIDSAYESQAETGEVSLMITKHCVRFSLSLCPKQAKGVTGVQGTVRAEPLQLINGKEKLTLKFDCKPCEMHVMGKLKPSVAKEAAAIPMTFYKQRPQVAPPMA